MPHGDVDFSPSLGFNLMSLSQHRRVLFEDGSADSADAS